jgi:hypothetical protein
MRFKTGDLTSLHAASAAGGVTSDVFIFLHSVFVAAFCGLSCAIAAVCCFSVDVASSTSAQGAAS